MFLKNVSLICLCMLSQMTSFGQSNCDLIFTGQVIDSHNGEHLVGAIVSLDGEKQAVTNSEGFFTIKDLCVKQYQFSVSHIECDPLKEQIELNGSTTKVFYMEHHQEQLEEILIEQTRKAGEEAKASQQIKKEELQAQQGQTFGDLLTSVEGVTLLKTGSTIAKPVVNGLHSQRVLVLNNGIRQEGQSWGSEHAPEIDPYTIQDITVIKGAGSVEYGADGLGGVVVVKPSPLPLQYGLTVEPSLGLFTNGRSLSSSINLLGKQNVFGLPISFQVQGTLKKAGSLKTPNYFLHNTSSGEQNFQLRGGILKDNYGIEAKWSQYNSELGILADSHIGNRKDLEAIIANGRPFVLRDFTYDFIRPRQEIVHEIGQLSAYKNTKLGQINAEFARQYNSRSEFDRYNDVPGLRLKTETYIGKVSLEHSLVDKMNGKIGLELLSQDYRYDGFYLIPEYQQSGYGGYIIENYELNNRLFLEAGLRYDAKSYDYQVPIKEFRRINKDAVHFDSVRGNIGFASKEFNNLWAGSAGVVFDATPELKLSSYLGYGTRQPLPNELFSDGVHHGTANYEVGDPTLVPEEALTSQLNAEFNNKKTRAYLNLYRNKIKNFIYFAPSQKSTPTVFTIRGFFAEFVARKTDAAMLGLDYELEHSLFDEKVKIQTSGAFLKADNQTLNEPLIYMSANRIEHSVNYEFVNDLSLNVQLQQVFRQNRTPNTIKDFAPTPDGYNLLNLSVDYDAQVLKNKLTLTASVDNALNKQYKDYLNRFRYYADELGRNIGLRVNYFIQ